MLPPNFEEPADFKWGTFTDASGANIRYGSLQPKEAPKGTIILVPGFREPIEKYFEVMRDMTARGFAVWMMDWHGQGGSDRFLPNPQKMHSEGYNEHIVTLHQFTQKIVKKSEGPFILMGHSMGGHIGLRYLKEHEGVFDSAALTAPMCDIWTPGFSKTGAKILAKGARLVRLLTRYVPRGGDWSKEKEVDPVICDRLTSDPVRFSVLASIFKEKPDLKMGDPTYGWILHTFDSIKTLQDENYLKAIKTPVLMGIAPDDKVVIAAASQRAAGLIPNCTRVDIPGARHEIWMERDELRNQWLARVDKFLAERLALQAPVPKKPDNSIRRPPGL